MVVAALFVVTDELLGILWCAAHLVFYEVNESLCVWSMLELEIDALSVLFFSDINAFLLGIIFENELF